MKKILFTVVLITSLPIVSLCQALTLENLVSLYNLELDECHTFLSSKGWRYHGVNQDKGGVYKNATWGFGAENNSTFADAWLYMSTDHYGNKITMNYQCSKSIFDNIQKKASTIGMKKVSSGLDSEGGIYALYVGANYVLNFKVSDSGTHKIQLVSKENFRSSLK